MHETITGFVGLDAHAESTAIGCAETGHEAPRFVGTVGPKVAELTKALAKLGDPAQLLIVYEAGPCGFALVPAPSVPGGGAPDRLRSCAYIPSKPQRPVLFQVPPAERLRDAP